MTTEQEVVPVCWHEWNAEGFFPGFDETEESLAKRVAFCRSLAQRLAKDTDAAFPFKIAQRAPDELLREALPLTESLYGIRPQWVPIFFSNRQLAPWHGGCAWIFQFDEEGPMAAILQLRMNFRSSSLLSRFYPRGELIAHECAHIGRMHYEEPEFEELLAYRASSSSWRRWWGPIVQSARESLAFVLILGVVVVANVWLALWHPQYAGWWVEGVPFALVLLALLRLFHRHRIFNKCARHLEGLYPPHLSQQLLYRLRDSEIRQFACLSSEEIRQFMDRAARLSFRWRFLKALYPPISI